MLSSRYVIPPSSPYINGIRCDTSKILTEPDVDQLPNRWCQYPAKGSDNVETLPTIPLVLGAVLALATARPAQASIPVIRILCPTWSGYAPIFVTKDLGYFKKLGIRVDIRYDYERADVMAATARHQIDMQLRTVGEYKGRPRSPQTPGVIIGTIDESLSGDGVVAAGSIKSVKCLKGKVVAAEPNVPGRLLLQLELHKAGLTLKDLKLKQIATVDSVAVFTSRSVSAVVSYQLYLSQALKVDAARKLHDIVSSAAYPGSIVDVIIVPRWELAKGPVKYRKFLIGIYRAIDYFHRDPAGFMKIVAPLFSLTPAAFKSSIEGRMVYTGLASSQKMLGSPEAPGILYEVYDTMIQLNLENGAANHKLTARHSIDSALIASLSPPDLKGRSGTSRRPATCRAACTAGAPGGAVRGRRRAPAVRQRPCRSSTFARRSRTACHSPQRSAPPHVSC